jgi:hypothetical protein
MSGRRTPAARSRMSRWGSRAEFGRSIPTIVVAALATCLCALPPPLRGRVGVRGLFAKRPLRAVSKKEHFTNRPLTRRASRGDLSHKGRGDVCDYRLTAYPNSGSHSSQAPSFSRRVFAPEACPVFLPSRDVRGSGAPTGAGAERRTRWPALRSGRSLDRQGSPANDAGRRASRRSTAAFFDPGPRFSSRHLRLVRQPAPGGGP